MELFQSTIVAWIEFFLARVPSLVLTLAGGWIVIKLVSGFVHMMLRRAGVELTIATLGRSMVTVAGWVLVIAAALRALGFSEVALAVSGSIALVALAVANSASGTTADIIAGVFLAADPDFKVGYTVTAAGVTGVIEAIDLRKTRIRNEDGQLVVIPNRSVESAPWTVRGRAEEETPAPQEP